MSQVRLTVEVTEASLEHVLAALHREASFMEQVGLTAGYEVRVIHDRR